MLGKGCGHVADAHQDADEVGPTFWRIEMKKLVIAIITTTLAISAFASCPAGTRYNCVPTYNGKMQCGCW